LEFIKEFFEQIDGFFFSLQLNVFQMNVQEDQRLFQLVKQNSEDAFRKIYEKYWDQLYKIAFQKTGCKEDAGDIVQELFLDIWRKRSDITIEGSLASYLFTALKNKCINFLISKNNLRNKIQLIKANRPQLSNNVEEYTASNELKKVIVTEVENMPHKMQLVFTLSRNHDLPSNKIANLLSLSDQTVRNQISKAIKRLKQRLTNYKEDPGINL